jgi:hypothetical protein
MYSYETQKNELFTESGSVMFTKIRDKVKSMIEENGCFMLSKAISGIGGDSFTMLACIDRLVELSEIKRASEKGTRTQEIVYIKY